MKKFILPFILFFIVIAVISFITGPDSTNLSLPSKPSAVSISEGKSYKSINKDFFFSTDKPSVMDAVKGIAEKAESTKINLEQPVPSYDLWLEFDNSESQGIHFTLDVQGNKGYLSTDKEPTVFYELPNNKTKLLKKLIGYPEK